MRTLRATPFTAATTFRRGKKNVFEVFLFENSNLFKTLFFSLTSLESSSFFIILSYPSFFCLDSRWKEGLVAKSFVVAAAELDSFTSPFHAQAFEQMTRKWYDLIIWDGCVFVFWTDGGGSGYSWWSHGAQHQGMIEVSSQYSSGQRMAQNDRVFWKKTKKKLKKPIVFSVDFWRFSLKRLGDLETKDVGGKNVLEIQQELMRVAAAAQQGKLQLADIQAHPNENTKHEHEKNTKLKTRKC